MKLSIALVALLVAAAHSKAATQAPPTSTANPKPMEERLKDMEALLEGLSRQVMLQQFFVEEKVRSDGNSGLKQTRVNKDGTKNYYVPAHIDSRFMAMHDHANYDRTVGMGELMPVMNGVEFRTRHNDYKLRMPSTKSETYHEVENIPFPDVPPSVRNKKTVDEQIVEMRRYFKAFKNQDTTYRDYKPYFKPVLCYLEGAWTTGATTFNEPFQSDRHSIDASSWFDLMDKVRFSSYSGTKSVLENFAYLPTTIISVDGGVPHYAQWNYRILCNPIKDDLPLSNFKLEDDLLYRFPQRLPLDKVALTRGARYRIDSKDINHYDNGRSLLDKLMYEIPGKNNYMADLHDNSFDMVMEDVHFSNHTLVNTGYYHRYFRTMDKGAMGTKSIHRGFSDANLFVAQTTHPQVAPMSVTSCKRVPGQRQKQCGTWTARYTYALPLEIIYLTPLFSWNPYDLPTGRTDPELRGHGTRNGLQNKDQAFNGTNFRNYYLTPADFYSTGTVQKDPADTAKKGAGVLDKTGQVRVMSSSGQRVVTPSIEGVGPIRLRYPIMPIHGEGAGVWKELNALKDMTMHMNRYASLYEERPGLMNGNDTDEGAVYVHFRMKTTIMDPPGEHNHEFFLNQEELDELKNGLALHVTTSEDMSHSHELVLMYRHHRILIKTCDGQSHCWDGHPNTVEQLGA